MMADELSTLKLELNYAREEWDQLFDSALQIKNRRWNSIHANPEKYKAAIGRAALKILRAGIENINVPQIFDRDGKEHNMAGELLYLFDALDDYKQFKEFDVKVDAKDSEIDKITEKIKKAKDRYPS